MKRQERESEERLERKQRAGGGGANKFTKLQSITDGINNDHVSIVYPQYKTSRDFPNDHLFLLKIYIKTYYSNEEGYKWSFKNFT